MSTFNKETVIKHDGQKNTIEEWSKILNIGMPTLISRLRRGKSVEEAFTAPVKKVKPGYGKSVPHTTADEDGRLCLTYRGSTLPVEAWAEEVGVHKTTIINRLRRGLTVAQTLSSAPPQKRTPRKSKKPKIREVTEEYIREFNEGDGAKIICARCHRLVPRKGLKKLGANKLMTGPMWCEDCAVLGQPKKEKKESSEAGASTFLAVLLDDPDEASELSEIIGRFKGVNKVIVGSLDD